MMPQWYAMATGMYRGWVGASLAANERWTRGAFEAREILLRASRRSGEDAREALATGEHSSLTLAARAGDLSRAQAFLWAAACFA